ncbi:MAG TPA: diguanylate cyclase [Steroidobacteraceae bacterium]|nr:diguanylate cyclase [Steroidobacteraceae bacterium]
MNGTEEKFRLLLVEDEPTQRLMLERQLSRAGYLVDTAENGEQALTKILEGQYHILLTDWDMPGMDGPTLCKRVRAANLNTYIYILLLTGHLTTDDLVVGLGAGANDYVRKPANQAELLARLSAGSRIVKLEQSLREANEKIQLLSITDPLAGTYNRRYLNDQLLKEVERAQHYDRPLAVIMADIDRFKLINDERGHASGDEVLKRFAELAKSLIRPSDWIARYGGEEFAIVLPETDCSGAAVAAEKVRAACAERPMPISTGALTVTSSFGVAGLPKAPMSVEAAAAAMMRDADAALYTSKHAGRNRVTVANQ